METRRKFIQKGLLGVSAATVMSTSAVQAFSGASTANASEDRFALGIAGYSFVHFDIDESLAMMKRMDVHFLCIKDFHPPLASRSEEHTSELQSLMRTSYAVFCLKKKNTYHAYTFALTLYKI